MGIVIDTVRWRSANGVSGWSYRPIDERPWGFDADQRIGIVDDPTTRLVAPDGRRYSNMIELLAGFRLRLCGCDRQTDPIDRLHRHLRAIDLGLPRHDPGYLVDDIFAGTIGWMEDHLQWLESERLVDCTGLTIAETVLSAEGRAALFLIDLAQPGSNVDVSPAAIRRMRDTRSYPRRDR